MAPEPAGGQARRASLAQEVIREAEEEDSPPGRGHGMGVEAVGGGEEGCRGEAEKETVMAVSEDGEKPGMSKACRSRACKEKRVGKRRERRHVRTHTCARTFTRVYTTHTRACACSACVQCVRACTHPPAHARKQTQHTHTRTGRRVRGIPPPDAETQTY